MGQYGNQPDFGTTVLILSEVGVGTEFPPSAIYVGVADPNDGSAFLKVQPVGNEPGDEVTIAGIYSGTFLPFVVTKITDKGGVTTETVLLYR